MALLASQLSTVANGVLPFSALAPQRNLDASPAGAPSGRTRTTGEKPPPERRHHGCGIRVKTVEESAGICGYDAYKRITGRQRHILVDTPGIPISIDVTPADTHDTRGAHCLLAGLKLFVSRLKKIWADAAYRGQELTTWCQATGEWKVEVVERAPGTRGFSVVPRRSRGGAHMQLDFSP